MSNISKISESREADILSSLGLNKNKGHTMTHKYEIDRRYSFEATEDSVCPVPGGTKGTVWMKDGGISSLGFDAWSWDDRTCGQITHFMVTEYPTEKPTSWVNIYSEEDLSGFTAKIRADGHRRPNCLACIKIEWTDGEGL